AEIGLFALIVIVILVISLLYRRKQLINELRSFYQEGNYVKRDRLPITNPFVHDDMTFITSLDGHLREDLPYTLILGTRVTSGGKNMSQNDYIGFFIPHHEALTDKWLAGWKEKVAERGDEHWAKHSSVKAVEKNWGIMGPPEELPIRAVKVDDGILLAWNGLHLRHTIEARIKDVLESLD